MADTGNSGSGNPLGNRKVLIAIALALAALIVGILLMRGQGKDATNMNGPDTAATQAAGMNVGGGQVDAGAMAGATPAPGQPNAAPTLNTNRPPEDTPPVSATVPASQ